MKLLLTFAIGLAAGGVWAADPALTIYNQNFAIVRDTLHLDLKAGINSVSYNQATMQLEPDSVVLRDPAEKHSLQILEQNYRADPITESVLLDHFVGKTIDFQVERDHGKSIVRGKIIRSGFVPNMVDEWGNMHPVPGGNAQPIIEVDGKLVFQLPGQPLFPSLADDSILKPTLAWRLNSEEAASFDAELGYITGGISWQAAYNLVLPETGDQLDMVGWVTINNQSGKLFEKAKIKLMAGDVNKIQNRVAFRTRALSMSGEGAKKTVSEKAFDDFHLYTIERRTTLREAETKQIEFVSATGIASRPIYTYDGESSAKVNVMREFQNSVTNNLGLPLPAGRLRFYRRDGDGQLEFTGENTIEHTPRDETIRVTTGDAFDVVGERKRTEHSSDNSRREADESFEIKVRNHKKSAVTVQVVEHLRMSETWKVTAHSAEFKKTEASTIEFPVHVEPNGEQVVTYTVHYTW